MFELRISSNANQIIAEVRQIPPRLGRNLFRAVARAVIDLQNYIRGEKLSGQVLNVRTGNLRNAIRAYPPGGPEFPIVGTVGVDRSAPYGEMQERGTRGPYEITPTRKKALMFMVGGERIFARHVMHPGLKTRPFMAPSFQEKREPIIVQLRAAVTDALKKE